jgi:hypothetical protein
MAERRLRITGQGAPGLDQRGVAPADAAEGDGEEAVGCGVLGILGERVAEMLDGAVRVATVRRSIWRMRFLAER